MSACYAAGPMATLKAMCVDAGFVRPETYIASGNLVIESRLVFESRASPDRVKRALESRLKKLAGKPVGVIVRTAAEMQAVLKANPFRKAEPKFNHVLFFDAPPSIDALEQASGVKDEEIRLGKREIYVHYPSSMGRSKLKIPAAAAGTARNMNTVSKLAEMAAKRTAKAG